MDLKLLAINTCVYATGLVLAYPICSGIESLLNNDNIMQALSDPITNIKVGCYGILTPFGALSTLYNSRN